jgi:hypothetical protein
MEMRRCGRRMFFVFKMTDGKTGIGMRKSVYNNTRRDIHDSTKQAVIHRPGFFYDCCRYIEGIIRYLSE